MLLLSFTGTIVQIEDFPCDQRLTIQNAGEITRMMTNNNSYIVNREQLMIGDEVTIYIDGNAPVPLIYPPQYHAVIIAKHVPSYTVKVAYFNDQLISEDHQLQLIKDDKTVIQYENGQLYKGPIENRFLAVVYDRSTRSIPAQTSPLSITVLCS